MKIAKDGLRSIVRIGYDGRVHKKFRGSDSDIRFENEIAVLKELEHRACPFVPRLLGSDPDTLTIITTNCGQPAEGHVSTDKTTQLFAELERDFGIRHDDPFPRNITYHSSLGRFCIIDFELAQILDDPQANSSGEVSRISWYGTSVDGSRKQGNDDCLSAFVSADGGAVELDLEGEMNITEQGSVFALSDGMGGTSAGGYASWLAVKELHQFLPARMGCFEGNADPLRHLAMAVIDLNSHVNRIAEFKPDCKDMGATLICGLFFGNQMHFAHVGDSRIYQFYEGELTQLTHDHTRVGKLERKGELNERQVRTHPQRNLLYQAIGTGKHKLEPQIGTISLKPGMWFLFCSDGLIDGLWNRRIQDEFTKSSADDGRSPKATAQAFLDEALRAAGKDDTTLFVIHSR